MTTLTPLMTGKVTLLMWMEVLTCQSRNLATYKEAIKGDKPGIWVYCPLKKLLSTMPRTIQIWKSPP
jgi:hypothetical protein